MEQKTNIFRSTVIVGFFTGISRLLGFVREILMAFFFGTELAKSAFDVAFRIPNLFRNVFGEGALSASFIPVFTESLQKDGKEEADKLAGRIMTLLGTVLLVIVGLCMIGVVLYQKHGAAGERATAVIGLLIIMFPYTFYICLVALCMGILNSYGKFWMPAAGQGLLNVVWIGVLAGICPFLGGIQERIYAVAWGILAAGAVQLVINVPYLKKISFNPSLSFDWKSPQIKKFLELMTPGMIGMGVVQINVFVSSLIALKAGSWAPAALTYAERLVYLPLGMFATALGSVLLPTLSHMAAKEQKDLMIQTLNRSLRSISFVMIPMAAALFVVAPLFVSLVFQWKGGVFNNNSALLTTRALQAYAPGLIVFSLYKIIVPMFYAFKDTKTPVRIGIITVLLNLTLNILSVMYLPEGYQHAGMAFGNVLASLFNFCVLAVILRGRLGTLGMRQTLKSVTAMIAASLCAAAAMHYVLIFIGNAHLLGAMNVKVAQAINLVIAVIDGTAVYVLISALILKDELNSGFKAVLGRFIK